MTSAEAPLTTAGLGLAVEGANKEPEGAASRGRPSPSGERVRGLGERLRGRLRAIPGVAVHDIGRVRGGIVSFTLGDRTGQEVKDALRRCRINVAISGERASLIDMRARGLRETVRASVNYYNTEAELDRFAEELARLVR